MPVPLRSDFNASSLRTAARKSKHGVNRHPKVALTHSRCRRVVLGARWKRSSL